VSRISGTLTIIDVAVDVALVWGPLASYFAARSPVPLRLEPVTPWTPDIQWPMQFDISVGRPKLLKEIDRALARRKGDIGKLLGDYRVPLVESAEAE
jgi:mxaJ protein